MAPTRVLVLNKATDYVHECIPSASACMESLTKELIDGAEVTVMDTTDGAFDSAETLCAYDLLIFNSNSGELFNAQQKTAFEAYLAKGKPVYGIHAATASFLSGEDHSGATVMGTTYETFAKTWAASFTDHPPLQDGVVKVEVERCAKLGIELPPSYETNDEWYNFDRNPADNPDVTVLAWADPTTFTGGKMGDRHPLIWTHAHGDSRVFYCALGHHTADYSSDEKLRSILRGGLRYCLQVQA